MLHMAVESAFDDLLTNWRAHEALKGRSKQPANDAVVTELARSRQALDKSRTRMHQLRVAIYPEADEIESIVESVWCEPYEIVVHLRWVDQHPTKPGNFVCACGHLVPVDWDRATR